MFTDPGLPLLRSVCLALACLTACLSGGALAQSCGDQVFTDITLSADLNCTDPALTSALEVRADNVTIDLNGHTIAGIFAFPGIRVNGHHNVTIRNGMLQELVIGIDTTDTSHLQVQDITFYRTTNGVVLAEGNDATISGNYFILGHETAVEISNNDPAKTARNNVIADNEFFRPYAAVHVCGLGTEQNTIKDNFIWQSIGFGILLEHTSDNLIINNTVLETEITAVRLDNASSNTIQGNSLRTGGNAGLAIYAADYSPSCLDSGDDHSAFNSFTGNHSIDFDYGALLNGSGAALVYKNQLNFNKIYDDGTGVYFGADTYANNAEDNAYTGTALPIFDSGSDNVY